MQRNLFTGHLTVYLGQHVLPCRITITSEEVII